MSTSSVLDFFEFMFQQFWSFLGSIKIIGNLSLRPLFITFLFFGVVWGFVFRKLLPSGD